MIPIPDSFPDPLKSLIGQLAPLRWHDHLLSVLDQRQLPGKEEWLAVNSVKDLFDAIRVLAVRGAPALGIAGALGIVLALREFRGNRRLQEEVILAAEQLKRSRPTAVNLSWGIDDVIGYLDWDQSESDIIKQALGRALFIWEDDLMRSYRIAEHSQDIMRQDMNILTHCNAGGLATGGLGTALAPMFLARSNGMNFHVWVDETRPLLQGGRLTAWELAKAEIPHTVIADNMAAARMAEGKIDQIITGADRIARNGDAANKTGTYGLAVLADWHRIPFCIAAPESTIDRTTESGQSIPIEIRDARELTSFLGHSIVHDQGKAYNPAFDVTPAKLIGNIVTERQKYSFPYDFSG